MTGRLLVAASILAGLAATVVVTARTGADLATVATLLPWHAHALSLLAFVADFWGRSVRIALVSGGIGHTVRLSTAALCSFAGEGAGAVTPSKAGAEPAKMAVLGRDGMDMGTAGAVMVGEMMFEVAALVPLALAAAVVLPAGKTGALGALAYAVVVTVAVFGLLAVARLPRSTAPRWWGRLRLTDRSWRILRVLARRFRHRSRALLHLRLGTTALVLAATVLHIAGRLGVLPALAAGRVRGAGIEALVGWPFLLLYGGAMIPTPGGGGVVEAGFAATLGGVLGPGHLAGLLIWWRVYTFYLAAMIGGGVLLLGGFRIRR